MKTSQENLTNNKPKGTSAGLLGLFFASLFIGLCYINWRFFATINYKSGYFSIFWSYLLVLGELYTFMIFTSFSLALLKKDEKQIYDECPNFKEKLSRNVPSVDIFVCTLNESVDLLTDTLLGCVNIDYSNKKVYVLDDGKRDEVKDLAEKIGVNYITRDSNVGYKAGNINNALKQTNGDFILIFDADHVPVRSFLQEILNFFCDETVALIQTPQHFFNPDPFQKNLSLQKELSNEQDLFYRVIEPGLANYGATVCCGTNFVVRRRCIEEVGGMPEYTVTEDSALGMMLEGIGYKICYYNKPIAAGRAPSNFPEYLKQRSRWAKGNIQIFFSLRSFKYLLKLNPIQFYFYFNGMLYFIYAFPRMIFLFSPVLYLMFGVNPVTAVVVQIVLFQMIYFFLKLIYAYTTNGKYRHALITDVYEAATAPFLVYDIIKLILSPSRLSKQKFSVTNKEEEVQHKTHKRHFIPVFTIFLILLAANIKGLWDLFHGPINPGAVGVNIFWNTYNLIVMYFAVKVIKEKPDYRKHIRIPTFIRTKLINNKNEHISVDVINLSKGGALLKFVYEDQTDEMLEEFLKKKLAIVWPDGYKTELSMINATMQSDNIYFQIKFAFDYSVKNNQEKFSKIKTLINTMYGNSDAWE